MGTGLKRRMGGQRPASPRAGAAGDASSAGATPFAPVCARTWIEEALTSRIFKAGGIPALKEARPQSTGRAACCKVARTTPRCIGSCRRPLLKGAHEQAGCRQEPGKQGSGLVLCKFLGLQGCKYAGNPAHASPVPASPRAKHPVPTHPVPKHPAPRCLVATPRFPLPRSAWQGGASPVWSRSPKGSPAQRPPQPQTTPAGTAGVWAVPRGRAGRGPGRAGLPLEQTAARFKCPTKRPRIIKGRTEQAPARIRVSANVYLEGFHKELSNSWFLSSRRDTARRG